jgi:cell division protein FtsQ
VTNFTSSRRYNAKDSLLLNSVKTIAKYINAHTFWSAQIAQVDVLPGNTFELVPVVGNHLIRIGNADNLEEKLDRLFLFYKQVAAKSGFDKYAVLDVQYDRQVIGSKSRFTSEVDSIQLQKNIEALIKKSKDAAFQDSLAEIAAFNAQVHRDTTIKNLIYRLEEEAKEQEKELDPKTLIDTQTVKAKVPAKVGVKQVTKTAAKKSANPVSSNVKPKPKAVMKKKDR